MNEYEKGSSVQVRANFRNLLGQLFDPTTVTVIVQRPDLTESTYTYGVDAAVVKVTTGRYYLWLLTNSVGRWGYKWEGLGAQVIKRTDTFMVYPSSVDEGPYLPPAAFDNVTRETVLALLGIVQASGTLTFVDPDGAGQFIMTFSPAEPA